MIQIESKNTGIMNMAKEAKSKAIKENETVEFKFKGKTCIVSSSTNLNWLVRDFFNSLNMGWETVGPDCVECYDEETLLAINAKNEELSNPETSES